jgi:hypothetical protein
MRNMMYTFTQHKTERTQRTFHSSGVPHVDHEKGILQHQTGEGRILDTKQQAQRHQPLRRRTVTVTNHAGAAARAGWRQHRR